MPPLSVPRKPSKQLQTVVGRDIRESFSKSKTEANRGLIGPHSLWKSVRLLRFKSNLWFRLEFLAIRVRFATSASRLECTILPITSEHSHPLSAGLAIVRRIVQNE